MGFLRTVERARDRFFWFNMTSDCKRYVRECLPCQKRKWQGQMKAPLGEFPPVSYPMERVGVDLIELPTSYSGNKYGLTIVDHFSKYLSVYPLPNKSAETVSKALMQFIAANGCPLEIVSDRGGEFVNELFNEVLRKLKIKTQLTTAYHPMSNGLTEKMNSVCKRALSHLSSDDKFTWDDSVPLVTLAINTAFQTSINDVPFFLFHGRDAHLPFGDFLSKQPINYASDTNYAVEMSLRLSNAFSQVRKQSKIANDKSAQY
jgi:transposase InsO family protein